MKKLLVLLLTVFALNSCEKDPEIIGLDAEKKMPKVDVCHYDADTDTWKTISINENALKAHLAHGDTQGGRCGYTYVPDDAFEQQLINLGYDEAPLDDYVKTANINKVLKLKMFATANEPNGNYIPDLTDFTGIEGFRDLEDFEFLGKWSETIPELDLSKNISLKKLRLSEMLLSSLNLSGNINLETIEFFTLRNLQTLNTDNCVNLKSISFGETRIGDIDLTNNLELEYFGCYESSFNALDFSKNIKLKGFWAEDLFSNITELDFSKNVNLNRFYIASSRSVEYINLQNGRNEYFDPQIGLFMTNLICVQVDDEEWANANWHIIPPAYFSENCGN